MHGYRGGVRTHAKIHTYQIYIVKLMKIDLPTPHKQKYIQTHLDPPTPPLKKVSGSTHVPVIVTFFDSQCKLKNKIIILIFLLFKSNEYYTLVIKHTHHFENCLLFRLCTVNELYTRHKSHELV